MSDCASKSVPDVIANSHRAGWQASKSYRLYCITASLEIACDLPWIFVELLMGAH